MKNKLQRYFKIKNVASVCGGCIVARAVTNNTDSVAKGLVAGTAAGVGFSLIGGAILVRKTDKIMEKDGYTKVGDNQYEKVIRVDFKR